LTPTARNAKPVPSHGRSIASNVALNTSSSENGSINTAIDSQYGNMIASTSPGCPSQGSKGQTASITTTPSVPTMAPRARPLRNSAGIRRFCPAPCAAPTRTDIADKSP
jgi:hypothetical protein